MRNRLKHLFITAACLMTGAAMHAQNLDVSIVNVGLNKIQILGTATTDFTSGANNQWASMNISWRIPKTAITSPSPTVAPPSATPEVTNEATQFTGATPQDAFTNSLELAMFDLTSQGLPDDGYWYFQVTGTTGALQNIPLSGTVTIYEFNVPQAWICSGCVEILQSDITGLPFSTTSFIDNGAYGDVFRLVQNNAPLPIQFMSFEANKDDKAVKLTWKTANEENVKGFYVQRSDNGANWTDIHYLPYTPDGNTEHTWNFRDEQPMAGINHYRIKEVDLDGRPMISAVRTVKFEISRQMTVSLYPVPVQQNATMRIESPVQGQATITVTDLTGRTVMQQRTVLNAGVNITRLNMGGLPSGTYFVQVQHQEQKWIRKIVKD